MDDVGGRVTRSSYSLRADRDSRTNTMPWRPTRNGVESVVRMWMTVPLSKRHVVLYRWDRDLVNSDDVGGGVGGSVRDGARERVDGGGHVCVAVVW